jgi:glycosyltransferase involved in cell wall biosynthesis
MTVELRTAQLLHQEVPMGLTSPKLGVVIPALNEEETVGAVVRGVPRHILGCSEVEIIVVDDGSSDATGDRAVEAGADRVITHSRNRGLVASFNHGIGLALARRCDVVVHLDADGQHDPTLIPNIVAPILAGDADIVVGVRPLTEKTSGTPVRRYGNRLVSWFFRRAFKVPVQDVTSGFRAFSRESLLKLNVVGDYTYTLDSLIQAARKRLAVAEVEIPALRRQVGESRMTHSIRRYIGTTGGQALRTTLHTAPLSVFGRAAGIALFFAAGFTTWFFVSYGDGGMHLPALLASLISFGVSAALFLSGLIADGVNTNRRLLEDALYRLKRLEADIVTEDREPWAMNSRPLG